MQSNWLIILLSLPFATGGAMLLLGYLVAMATAFGQRQWAWAIGILLLWPVAIVYVLLHWDSAAWPGKLLLGGAALVLISVAIAYVANAFS